MWDRDPQLVQRVVRQAEGLGFAVIRNGAPHNVRGYPFSLVDEDMTPLAIGDIDMLDAYLQTHIETRVLH